MEKLFSTYPSIALGMPSGTSWHMLPAQLPTSSANSFFFGSYPEADSMLSTSEQAQELIDACNFCLGLVDTIPCYLLYSPQTFLPMMAPILAEEESEMEMDAAKFWVKNTDLHRIMLLPCFLSKTENPIGMTLKSSKCSFPSR